MNTTRVLGWLGLAGGVGWLLVHSVFTAEFGYPGTAQYLLYEAFNHAWTPALVLMLAGFAGLYQYNLRRGMSAGRRGFWLAGAGFVMMIAGNAVEFWLLTDMPYGELNARAWSWITFLLGMLVALIGCLVIGLAGWRSGSLPRWCALPMLLALPAFLACLFIRSFDWWLLPLGVAAIAVSVVPALVAPRVALREQAA